MNRAIAPKWVLANTVAGGTDADRVVRQVPATLEEFALRPLAHSWTQFQETATHGRTGSCARSRRVT